MKQNFQIGMYAGKEWLVVQDAVTRYWLGTNSEGGSFWTHKDNITNLRPVKVVDMDDIVLKLLKKEINAAEQMLTKGCAPSFAIDSICLKIVTAAYPSTPTPPPEVTQRYECEECGRIWPYCPTIQAIEKELG